MCRKQLITYRKEYTHLFNNDGRVFPHSIHDIESGVLSGNTGRFRSYSEGIYQRLWVMFANFGQQVVDVASDVPAWSLDARNDLSTGLMGNSKSSYITLTCGITSNHVSTSTTEKPLAIAWLTSS